jgi:surface antigen
MHRKAHSIAPIALAVVGLIAAGQTPALAQYGPQYAAPTGGPLSSIFSCANQGNRQGAGAIIGGLAGGLIGNQVADNERTLGTVLGAAIGAAAGSYIGCKMQTADQQRAQAAAQLALERNQSQTWYNEQTGAQGRIDIVNSYNFGQQQNYGGQPSYGQQGYGQGYNQSINVNSINYAPSVERPREYQPSEGRYSASGTVNIRSGPSQRANIVGSLRPGETIDGLVRVEGTDWVLAVRNGVAVGYVSESVMRFQGAAPVQQQQPQQMAQGAYDPRGGPPCRVFDQTFQPRGGASETQRHTACLGPQGQWVVQT